jgi:hypothetical protein
MSYNVNRGYALSKEEINDLLLLLYFSLFMIE